MKLVIRLIEVTYRNGTTKIIAEIQLKEEIDKIMMITEAELSEKLLLLSQGYQIGFNGIYFKEVIT